MGNTTGRETVTESHHPDRQDRTWMLPPLPLIKELSRAWCMAPLELHFVAHDSDRELESLTSVHYVCF